MPVPDVLRSDFVEADWVRRVGSLLQPADRADFGAVRITNLGTGAALGGADLIFLGPADRVCCACVMQR